MRLVPVVIAALAACRPAAPVGSAIEAHSPALKNGVLTQSIGIETLGERFTPYLAAGCRVPCVKSSTFSTTEDSQTQITLHLLRGDSGKAADQHTLGRYAISGFPVGPRGIPQVLVIFGAVGEDLTLDARDAATGVRYHVARVGD